MKGYFKYFLHFGGILKCEWSKLIWGVGGNNKPKTLEVKRTYRFEKVTIIIEYCHLAKMLPRIYHYMVILIDNIWYIHRSLIRTLCFFPEINSNPEELVPCNTKPVSSLSLQWRIGLYPWSLICWNVWVFNHVLGEQIYYIKFDITSAYLQAPFRNCFQSVGWWV